MKLSDIQKATFFRVARATLRNEWYRASTSGERVTLWSLYQRDLLTRRVHRGEGTQSPAHEYQLTDWVREEVQKSLQSSDSGPSTPSST